MGLKELNTKNVNLVICYLSDFFHPLCHQVQYLKKSTNFSDCKTSLEQVDPVSTEAKAKATAGIESTEVSKVADLLDVIIKKNYSQLSADEKLAHQLLTYVEGYRVSFFVC